MLVQKAHFLVHDTLEAGRFSVSTAVDGWPVPLPLTKLFGLGYTCGEVANFSVSDRL